MQISLPVLLTIIFMVLKLTGYIAWSWWLVTLPLWLPIPIVTLIFGISVVLGSKLSIKRVRKS